MKSDIGLADYSSFATVACRRFVALLSALPMFAYSKSPGSISIDDRVFRAPFCRPVWPHPLIYLICLPDEIRTTDDEMIILFDLLVAVW